MPSPSPSATTTTRRILLLAGLGLPLMGFRTADSVFAPKAKLLAGWSAFTQGGDLTLDHSAWSGLLARRVVVDANGVTRMRYGDFSRADRATLAAYLAHLGAVPVARLGLAEQLAFWINLYNAAVVRIVLDAYPVKSIQDIDISPGLFANGPWKAAAVTVGGRVLSLDNIEHGIIRPIWRDPRIHYALNCASMGCPNLRGEAYEAARIEAQLDEQARLFVNAPRGVSFAGDNTLTVSKLYAWFCDDFGGDDQNIITHLKGYADSTLAARLAAASKITGTQYDWALNDAR